MLKYEIIWGHIDILVVVVRRLSRRWKVKTLLAGPSPTSPIRRRLPTPLFLTLNISEHTKKFQKEIPVTLWRYSANYTKNRWGPEVISVKTRIPVCGIPL